VIAAAAAIDAGVCKTAIKRLVRCSAEDARLVPHPDMRSSAFNVAKRQRLLQKLSRIEHTARDAGGLFAED